MKIVLIMMYHTWRVSKLKEELKNRGASLQGSKTDLIERLESYDMKFNFGAVLDNNVEPSMVLPANEAYQDINSHSILPPLNKTQIRHYLSYTNKKMDKALQLYESRYLIAARSNIFNSYTFIKGIWRKTMKSVHYEINIKLDEYGNIEEAHCECPVGSGNSASCKHVAVLLLAVESMVKYKFILLCETQRLQQSPVHAEKILRKKGSVIYSPYDIKKIDKENYKARFRSLILNFPNSTMPMKQLYEPANSHALQLDHDYVHKSTS